MFIDEIDGLVVQREDDDTPDTRRIIAELLAHVTATIKQDEYMGELVAHINECSVLPKNWAVAKCEVPLGLTGLAGIFDCSRAFEIDVYRVSCKFTLDAC